MSSKSKNFRRRADDDDKEDNDTNGSAGPAKVTPNIPVRSSSKASSSTKAKKSHQKLLSFAEDEDSESPFSRPPKSSSSSSRLSKRDSSHKITSGKDRVVSLPPASVPSNVQPQAGQYTKEALLELQKNTRTLASSRPRPPAQDAKPPSTSEPVIVLKGLVKPESNGDKVTTDEEMKSDKDDAQRRMGLLGIGKREPLEGFDSGIPDQAMINAIRAKRERLRQSRAAAPDYISLDGGSNHGEAEGLSDEEPEFQTRIAMLGEKTDVAKKGVFEDVDVDERPVHPAQLNVEDDEDEEEGRKWEEEQFRKGLGKRMDEGHSGVSRNVTAVQSAQTQSYMYPAPVASVPPAGAPSIGGVLGGLQNTEALSISQQAEIAKQALQVTMTRLRETHGRTMTSLARADENLSTSLIDITNLEKELAIAGEKYVFMQELRNFVRDLCDFLQDKAPYIEELEEQMQELHKKRASVTLERRAADYDDEMTEVQAAVDAAMSVLGKGGGSAATFATATSAAQAAAAAIKHQKSLPVIDEFGRDLNQKKRLDMARRADARQRRKARSDSKRMVSTGNDISYPRMEGESSTDESDNDSEAYKSNRDQLLQVAEEIFSDAEREYSQLSLVKERFERWKRLYAGAYRDAFMSESIPAIFSPYVRLELLKWDPLHEDVNFDDMRWHKLLFDYGVPEDGNFSPGDVDADLVPGLVEKIALPILHHEVAHCWDILSSRETKNAVSATSLIINYVPASSKALKELIVAIRTRLAEAVSNLVVPTWSTKVMKAVPNAARIAAYQFGVALRLMRNICMWRDILAVQVLEKLALDEVLFAKVLPHVQNLKPDIHDAIARTERIIASFSGVWAGPSVTGARSRKLQPLVDYVRTLGETLEKKHASKVAEAETSGLVRRLKEMLVELNEYDEARAILRTFNLKEAL